MSLVMPTRVLIVGGGGREHALAWKLAAEPGINDVIVAPGSDAIAAEPRTRIAPDVDPLDGTALARLATAESIELAFIGPEAPLAAGMADDLRAAGVPTFGPSAAAARIESSKAFCREIATAAGVRMAQGGAFEDGASARQFAARLDRAGSGVVVKADGLAAGKGVTVSADLTEAYEAIERELADGRHGRVVIEERIDGREASVIVLTDGDSVVALPAARDHKRLLDGDGGPNTGGMGGYSPLPDLPDDAVEDIVDAVHRPILGELARRATPFRGALYAGLMLTDAGPVLLECNARFGDPETQIILPRLAVPLGPLLLAAARRELGSAARRLGLIGRLVPVSRRAAVGIVLASRDYPAASSSGDPIEGLDRARSLGAMVFHSGTRRSRDDGFETSGGRILTVVGRGDDIAEARASAEDAADAIQFAGIQRRHDIGASPALAAAGARP